MRKMILSLVMSVVSMISFSQSYLLKFKTHLEFNSGKHITYEEVIKEENILESKLKSNGSYTYYLNLDEKVILVYYNDNFVSQKSVLNHKTENGLLFITLLDVDAITNEETKSKIVINQSENDRIHPFFTFYYVDSSDGSTKGFKTM